jgi:hypothetical protein
MAVGKVFGTEYVERDCAPGDLETIKYKVEDVELPSQSLHSLRGKMVFRE